MAIESKKTKRPLEDRERDFLVACGFDMSNGFWSEDVTDYKKSHPGLYEHHVVNGEPLKMQDFRVIGQAFIPVEISMLVAAPNVELAGVYANAEFAKGNYGEVRNTNDYAAMTDFQPLHIGLEK